MEEEDGKNGRGSRKLSGSGTNDDRVGNEIVTQYGFYGRKGLLYVLQSSSLH